MTNPPAGWYPNGDHHLTWWDGQAWTDHHQPIALPRSVKLSTPDELVAPAFTARRTDTALELIATNLQGRAALGAREVTIPYAELLTIEFAGVGIRIRKGRWVSTLPLATRLLPEAHAFVDAMLEQHRAATARDIGTGSKLGRAERKQIVERGVDDAFSARFTAIRDAIIAGDIPAETAARWDLIEWTLTQPGRDAVQRVDQAIAQTRDKLSLPPLSAIGNVGAILLYDDRVISGAEGHAIDESTEAQVFLDGQRQVTTRASFTSALATSWLPGTALIGALAMPKQQVHDHRTAHFYVGSNGWTWGGPVHPNAVPLLRSFALRINAASASMKRPPAAREPASNDILTQLERIAALQADGTITSDQAMTLKDQILRRN